MPSEEEAKDLISELKNEVGIFKIGLQLFTSAGASFVKEVVEMGIKVFLDVKFHDIPNTVAKASVEVARLGIWMFNVHALGGEEMLKRTVDEVNEICSRENINKPKVIGVTILTSADENTLKKVGINHEIEKQVLKLAKLSGDCGLDGVVASPNEVKSIRKEISNNGFTIVTPGIRPGFATKDDQKRVMTPKEALNTGSDYLVIGRPITKAKDKIKAVRKIIEEIQS